MKKVYLAGPISGENYLDATEWRVDAKRILSDNGITGYSPMRGKAYLSKEEQIQDSYSDHTMSSITGINVRDYNDCRTADAILVNLLEAKKVSIGTVMEIAWGRAFSVPVVIVMERESIHDHGMLTYGNIIVSTIEEGIFAICQLLND
jgi:nucleoside 2-deoxyribosyltransferase